MQGLVPHSGTLPETDTSEAATRATLLCLEVPLRHYDRRSILGWLQDEHESPYQ
jgi:hypothetical protein